MTRASRLLLAIAAMAGGIALQQWLLWLTDARVHFYPHLADPILSRLPTLNISDVGEFGLATTLAVFSFHHFRKQPERTRVLLVAIGMLYAGRGVFLWLMPIGAPPGAPANLLQLYPFSSHSYFPSGHVGLISLLAWMCRDLRWRRFFLVVAVVFGAGTLVTKAHYTGDLLGGLLLSHAVATLALQASERLAPAPVASQAPPA